MYTYQEIAYYEDSLEGILKGKGFNQDQIEEILWDNWLPRHGLEIWENTKTREQKTFQELKKIYG